MKNNQRSKKIKTKEKGITLIALVITIIVMLILAGVSIAMLTGENGILAKAAKAREQTQIKAYEDKIRLAITEENINQEQKTEKEKLEGIKEILKKDQDFKEAKITGPDENEKQLKLVIVTKEGYIYYVYKDKEEHITEEYKGNKEEIGDPELNIEIKEGDIKYTYEPTGWTNGEVKIKIEIQKEEYKQYKIEYTLDGKKWNNYAGEIIVKENTNIIARLTNGTTATKTYGTGNVTNIDKEKPEINETLTSSNITTKGFTLNIGITDAQSGLGKIKWKYKKIEDTSYTEIEEIYKKINGSQAGETIQQTKTKEITDLTTGTYKVQAEIYDVAGNKTESEEIKITTGTVISGETGAISFSTATWSNGKATTTISTNTEYKIQYQINSTTGAWLPETGATNVNVGNLVHGDKVYARLWDGTNGGAYATLNILDDIDPTASLSVGAITDTKTVLLTANVGDNQSGISKYEIYVNDSRVSTDASYTITNMPFYTSYSCYIVATDVAGNTKQSETITVRNEGYISNLDDLKSFATTVNSKKDNFAGKTVKQTANINLGCNSSNQWTPISGFAGTYDGQRKEINNIYINKDNTNVGLFGTVTGTIKNVKLMNGTVCGGNVVGGIVANNNNGTILECYNGATVKTKLGQNGNGNGHCGGIAGINAGTVNRCVNKGVVTIDIATDNNNICLGGICGFSTGTIYDSYNTGTIDSSKGKKGWASGIVGSLEKNVGIQYCYNIGTIKCPTSIYVSNAGLASTVISGGSNGNNDLWCYYLNTCIPSDKNTGPGNKIGEQITEANFKNLGGIGFSSRWYKKDTNNYNNGWPILSWEY